MHGRRRPEAESSRCALPILQGDSEPWVRISIRDEGTGYRRNTAQDLRSLFHHQAGGNGLGLATAYAIVSKHGGVISASRNRGLALCSRSICPPRRRNLPGRPAGTTHTGTERLLVMDDDPSPPDPFPGRAHPSRIRRATCRGGAEAIASLPRGGRRRQVFPRRASGPHGDRWHGGYGGSNQTAGTILALN